MALDVLAVILGIFYTIRKLDAQSRAPADFPHVPLPAFEAWQSQERQVYHLAALACALKLVLGLSFQYLVAPGLPVRWVQIVGAAIDLAWLLVVLRTTWAGRQLRRERAHLGIVLGVPAKEEPPPDGP